MRISRRGPTVPIQGSELDPTELENSVSLMDCEEVARRLGTTVRHIRRLVFERRIPYVKVGRLVRFDPDDMREWLEPQKVEVRVDPVGGLRPWLGRAGLADHRPDEAGSDSSSWEAPKVSQVDPAPRAG